MVNTLTLFDFYAPIIVLYVTFPGLASRSSDRESIQTSRRGHVFESSFRRAQYY